MPEHLDDGLRAHGGYAAHELRTLAAQGRLERDLQLDGPRVGTGQVHDANTRRLGGERLGERLGHEAVRVRACVAREQDDAGVRHVCEQVRGLLGHERAGRAVVGDDGADAPHGGAVAVEQKHAHARLGDSREKRALLVRRGRKREKPADLLARLEPRHERAQRVRVATQGKLHRLERDAGVARLRGKAPAALPQVGVEVAALALGRRQAGDEPDVLSAEVGRALVSAVPHIRGRGDDLGAHGVAEPGLARNGLVDRVDGHAQPPGDVLHRHAARGGGAVGARRHARPFLCTVW